LTNHPIQRHGYAGLGPYVRTQTRRDDRLLSLHRTAADEIYDRDILARAERASPEITDDARHDEHQREERNPTAVERRRHRFIERRNAVAGRPVGRGRSARRRRGHGDGAKARRRRVPAVARAHAETERRLFAGFA